MCLYDFLAIQLKTDYVVKVDNILQNTLLKKTILPWRLLFSYN